MLLGEAGAIAGAAVWISFLIGGVFASLLGYVCVKLGIRYPSSGGLIVESDCLGSRRHVDRRIRPRAARRPRSTFQMTRVLRYARPMVSLSPAPVPFR